MKLVAVASAILATTNALAAEKERCCFTLSASGGDSGPVGQIDDGQTRIGNGTQPGEFCIDEESGGIIDGKGRGCFLTPPTSQLQCDVGAPPQPGLSLDSKGRLDHNGSTDFVACRSGQGDQLNIYTNPAPEDVNGCEDVFFEASECHPKGPPASVPGTTASATTTAEAPPGPGHTSTSVPSAPSGHGTETTSTSFHSAPSGIGPGAGASGTSGASRTGPETSHEPSPSGPGGGPHPGPPESSSAPSNSGTSTPTMSPTSPRSSGTPTPTTSPSSPRSSGTPTPTTTPSSPRTSGTPTSTTSFKPPETSHSTTGSAPGGPSGTETSTTEVPQSHPTGPPTRTEQSESKTSHTESEGGRGTTTTAHGTSPPSPSETGCPPDLESGNYEFPHLIIPIDSSSPSKVPGTSFNGTVTPEISSIFNFDIPPSLSGKRCSLVFLFPNKADLVTSSFSFGGDGAIDFTQLQSPASLQTSASNAPAVKTDFGITRVSPGHSYTITTFSCPAGETIAFEMANAGTTQFEWFEDFNPAAIGLFITTC